MESPRTPNPKSLPGLLSRSLLLFLCFAGCLEQGDPRMELRQSPDKELLVGRYGVDVDNPNTDNRNRENVDGAAESLARNPNESTRVDNDESNRANRSAPNKAAAQRDKRPPILAVQTRDSTVLGVPIGLFSDQTLLLRNDGSIQKINTSEIVRHTVLQDRFKPMERTELAQQLRAEFGRNYVVKSDPPYMLVARAEHMEGWQQRFRSLYHSFRLYCSTHALTTREIEFPLVAVVFGTREEFLRYANSRAIRADLPENCAGYYFSENNRIVLYESTDMSIEETRTTICHEATHQLAFNVGLHQRYANVPRWVIEGFATMFESPMFSGLQSRQGKSQWPDSKRQRTEKLCKKPEVFQNLLTSLVSNDRAFKSDTIDAYCVAWAMTAYFSQRSSQQFGAYLLKGGNMEPFQEYTSSQRVSDFQSAFGSDPRIQTKKIIQYLDNLE